MHEALFRLKPLLRIAQSLLHRRRYIMIEVAKFLTPVVTKINVPTQTSCDCVAY